MQGTVEINGAAVYGYAVEEAGRTRLRLSVDEWDRLGLCEGQRVRVRLPRREVGEVLLMAADRVPPFVWVELRPMAVRQRAG